MLEAVSLLADEPLGYREAVFRQLDRRRNHLAQRHRAEALERGRERAEGRRDAGREDVLVGHVLEAATAELLRRRAGRRRHVAVHREDALARRLADQGRTFAAERVHLWVDQTLDETRRDGGVDRVAARFEDI